MNLVQAMAEALSEMFGGQPRKQVVVKAKPVEATMPNPHEALVPNPVHQKFVLPMESAQKLKTFVDENKSLVYDYMLRKLRGAIRQNRPEVLIFVLGDSSLHAKIKKNEYEDTIQMMIQYFLKAEEYEKIIQCKELLQRLYVNRVIDESKQ